MKTIATEVERMTSADRTAFERFVGQPLRDGQSVVVKIFGEAPQPSAASPNCDEAPKLPEWCRVLADMDEEEERVFDAIVSQRPRLARPIEID